MLGFGSGSIYDFGCYLVSLVNGLAARGYDFTPRTFNNFLKEKNAWTGQYRNYIDVDRLDDILPDIFESYKRIEPTPDMSTIKWYLDRDYLIVAKVNAKAIGGSGSHFVYVEYIKDNVTWIFDPWFGDLRKVTDRYGKLGNLLGLRVFKVKRKSGSSDSESDNMSDMYTMPSGKQIDLSNKESMKVVANVYDEVINKQLYVKKSEVEKQIAEQVEPLRNELEKSHSELRQEIENRKEQVSKLELRLLNSDNQINTLNIKLKEALENVKYVEVLTPEAVNEMENLRIQLKEEQQLRDQADKEKGRALNDVARLTQELSELESKHMALVKKRAVEMPASKMLVALWSALWAKLQNTNITIEG